MEGPRGGEDRSVILEESGANKASTEMIGIKYLSEAHLKGFEKYKVSQE